MNFIPQICRGPFLEGGNHRREAKMFQQESQPLRPGNGCSPGNCGQFLRIDPLGKFRKDHRHLIEPAGMTRVSNEVERRRFG